MANRAITVCITLTVVVGVAWAAGDWSAAQSKASEFKDRYTDLRKLTPDETRKLVSAICDAEDGARRTVGQEASSRVRDEVRDKESELERIKSDATHLLDDVISDDNLKDKQDDAKSLKEDVERRWDSIERMTQSLRGANHPVVAYMLQQGQEAHRDRENDCDAKEVTLDSGRVDCLMAKGETCLVIELKPDNSRAISKGNDQARRYVEELDKEAQNPASSDIMKRLIDTKSDFAKCKRFEARVDCYKLCPDIDDENNFHEASPNWRTDCG
jgi:polyhydroxyalkanoate synthesis regulator phasin